MDLEEIIPKNKWAILKELARKPQSASDLSKKTGQTIANVTRLLKLFEAKGIIKKQKTDRQDNGTEPADKESKRQAGKPKVPYELAQDIIIKGTLRQGTANLTTTKYKDLTDFQKYLANIAQVAEPDTQYALIKFACETNLAKKASYIGMLKQTEQEVHLFIILENGLEEFRTKHSNITVDTGGKTKKVISWSHNKRELEEGLGKGEEYFKNLLKAEELLSRQLHE